MKARRKLLLIAGYFPPISYSTGSVRTWNTAKYMARLGWRVTVVTPDPTLIRPCYVENAAQVAADLQRENIHRITTGIRWRDLSAGLFDYPLRGPRWFVGGIFRRLASHLDIDYWSGWNSVAEKACSGLTPLDVDVILVSGAPHISFRLAQRLSRRLRRPYVLDYRDLWTRNPHQRPGSAAKIRQERELLNGCSAVTVISPSIASVLNDQHGVGPKLHVVTNGYDEDSLRHVMPHDFGHFAIVYAGALPPPNLVITPLMVALKDLKGHPAAARDWKFHYYGPDGEYVRRDVAQLDLSSNVFVHGKVSHAEALSALRGANIAVVITSVAENASIEQKGIITGKIFEAIGLRIPLLIIAPPGSDVEAIAEVAGLGRCFRASDTEGVIAFLIDALHGRVPAARRPEQFSWASIGRAMDSVLCSAADAST